MKLNKILLGATITVASLVGISSCSEDYVPTVMPDNAQVYFSNINSREYLLEENQSEVKVEVTRLNTNGELSVGLTANDTTQAKLFTVPNTVTFADGDSIATFPITFKFSDLVADNDYALDINLSSEFTDYADAGVKVIIKYAPWSAWEPYGWEYTTDASGKPNYSTYSAWATDFSTYITGGYEDSDLKKKLYGEEIPTYSYSQMLSGTYAQPLFYRQSMLNPQKAQLLLCDWFYGVNLIIDWNKPKEEGGVDEFIITPQSTGYIHSTYGLVYVIESFKFFNELRPDKVTELDGKQKSFFDKEKGTISLNVTYGVKIEESWAYFGFGMETIQLPGYEQPDYSLDMVDEGTFKSDKGELSQVLNMTLGADVDHIKFAWFAGEKTDELVAEKAEGIFSGEIESVSTKENGRKVIAVDEEGDYYLVAVLYDAAGTRVGTTSMAFNVEDANAKTWEVVCVGDYTYTVAFTDAEGNPFVDDSLTLSVCEQDATLYKIANWGYGVDFVFSMTEDGAISVAEQFTGATIGEDELLVCDYNTYTGTDGYPSYYEDGVYSFALVYYAGDLVVPGYETFAVTENASARINNSLNVESKSMTLNLTPFKDSSIIRAKKSTIRHKSNNKMNVNKNVLVW